MSATFKGLVYVKQGAIGSKSEGPDYFLQTKKEEYLLLLNDRHHWMPDYELEFHCRRFVEVAGAIDNSATPAKLKVSSIKDIPSSILA